ncbi:MAG TPA: nucleotidyltransferase family protein [Bacillota bacterium]|nr:nucleotidyltransferase family protein [Bacillota bacterium]
MILAAGASSRMGTPKQQLLWEGQPLLLRVTAQALAARVDPVVVVLGHRREELQPILDPAVAAAGERLRVVGNPGYRHGGQWSSMQAALVAMPADGEAVVILLVDMPLIRRQHIDRLVTAFDALRGSAGDRLIVAFSCGGRRGHPVLVGSGWFPVLRLAPPEGGLRGILRLNPNHVVELTAGEEVLVDLDAPQDYEALLNRRRQF